MRLLFQARTIATAVLLLGAIEAGAEETLHAIGNNTVPHALLALDPSDGTILGSTGITDAQLLSSLTIDGSGRFLSIDGFNDGESDYLFQVDPDSGAGTRIGATGQNWNFRSLEYDPKTRTLFGATDSSQVVGGSLFEIDSETGAASFIATITGPTEQAPASMAIDSRGNAYINGVGWTLHSLDLDTGAATLLGTLDTVSVGDPVTFEFYTDLAFDGSDVLYGSANSDSSGNNQP